MTAQANATQSRGRNRGARAGSEHKAGQATLAPIGGQARNDQKDQTPALKVTAQKEATAETVASIKVPESFVNRAIKIVEGSDKQPGFRAVAADLQSLKDQTEAKRGGLSEIVFQIARVAAEAADQAGKPQLRAGYFAKLTQRVESWEVSRYAKEHKMQVPDVKVRDALGGSWQTYKSQILRSVAKGYNPLDVAKGTTFRELGTKSISGEAKKQRAARQTKGPEGTDLADTEVTAIESMRQELRDALAQLIAVCKESLESEQLEYADAINKLSTKIAKETTKEKDVTEAPASAATASM